MSSGGQLKLLYWNFSKHHLRKQPMTGAYVVGDINWIVSIVQFGPSLTQTLFGSWNSSSDIMENFFHMPVLLGNHVCVCVWMALRPVFLHTVGLIGQPGVMTMRRNALVAWDETVIQHELPGRESNPGPSGWQPSTLQLRFNMTALTCV